MEGLTCGSCVQSVRTAVLAVAGVSSASIDLIPGGASTLTVSGSVTPEDIRSAVAVAGYSVITS
ncbi:MAG: heavy-metal-associated domain-containing protein [Specibacter sp.]